MSTTNAMSFFVQPAAAADYYYVVGLERQICGQGAFLTLIFVYCISPSPIILLKNCSSWYDIIFRGEFYLNSGWLQLFSPSRK
mmetsp:Transcript_2974/g.5454  ORF Transcript_2974/g.5454 Transcript_2974/m.5454 type:complete len:83 (-) Transcript_2974:482-730(-)